MNMRVTISITPEDYMTLLMASREREMSISKTVITFLRESNSFNKYLERCHELESMESAVTIATGSVGIIDAFHKSRVSKSVDENHAITR
ncbi:hypothetical protein [Ferroplasma sp.]|uniref:hypothetical protein n=1 Tax=Ferroplasma sp. TaxID=2591003 RepID=UPI00307E9376